MNAAAAPARLVAAFREGFGLAAIAVIDGPDGIRVVAAAPGAEITCAPAETVHCRWWCPRAFEAASIAAAAAARLHGRETRDGATLSACQAVVRAAKQRHVDLHSDEEILDQAKTAIARIDDESNACASPAICGRSTSPINHIGVRPPQKASASCLMRNGCSATRQSLCASSPPRCAISENHSLRIFSENFGECGDAVGLSGRFCAFADQKFFRREFNAIPKVFRTISDPRA